MTLPPVHLQIFLLFWLIQMCVVLINGFLCSLRDSRGLWAALKGGRDREPAPYRYTLFILLVLGHLLGLTFVPISVARTIAFGLMLLYAVAPLWWLRGPPRYFGCVQGLALTIYAYVWPQIGIPPYNLRFLLAAMVSYIVLFIATVPLRRHGQKKSGAG